MLKKNYFSFIFILLLVLSINNVLGFFPNSHEKFTIEGFHLVNSPITNDCRNYLYDVLDGNLGTDAGVVHYSEDGGKLFSYITPHTKSAYEKCLKEAGVNIRQRCKCYGEALHMVQDPFSHLENGVTAKYIKNQLGNNYGGHMVVERSFELKHRKLMEKNQIYAITSGILDDYDKKVLNTFFDENARGELIPNEDLQLFSSIAGFDMTQDFMVFRTGYLGEGFYSKVYKDKIDLPWWMHFFSLGTFFFGFILGILMLILGKTKWKYYTVLQFFLMAIIGLILWYSYNPFNIWDFTNFELPSWKIVTILIETPAKFGYLSVSDYDVEYYDRITQDATNKFLETGRLNIMDATGLTYCAKTRSDGSCEDLRLGALNQAEKSFKFVFYWIFIPLFVILQIFIIFKSLGIRIIRRRQL